MQQYLRRFWQPVAMSSRLKDLPVAVRILGEDLVLFRDKSGRVGLLDLALLPPLAPRSEFGVIAERCGIRAAAITAGSSPSMAGFSTRRANRRTPRSSKRRFQGACPRWEFAGLVFAYMGPPELKPEFPYYDVFDLPDDRMVPYSLTYPCNWLQIFENVMDPAHGVFLHTRISFEHFAPAWGEMPVTEFRPSPLGMIYITTRRVGDLVWVRMNDIILPNLAQAGAIWKRGQGGVHPHEPDALDGYR